MAKNIVICSDGTWNSAYKRRGTNVFKLYEALDHTGRPGSGEEQIAFYDDGVGTQKLRLLRILGGAFGLGLARNVRQLYTSLARVYEPGDRIYLFGFSRGAFTVRTLADMICRCGIVDVKGGGSGDGVPLTGRALRERVRRAYKTYRSSYREVWTRNVDKWIRAGLPQTHEPATIQMVGVWDTVDAVGLPFRDQAEILNLMFRFKFPDTFLPSNVDYGYQALAIDEERTTFEPILWNERINGPPKPRGAKQVVTQVWFAGAHANVGGGRPKQGMSLVSLFWMMEKAESLGVRFSKSTRRGIETARNVHDELYDSRSGIAALYRYRPRNIRAMCEDRAQVRIHESAVERIRSATDGYAPATVPAGRTVSRTGKGQAAEVDLTPVAGRLATANRNFWNKARSLPADLVRRWQVPLWLSRFIRAGGSRRGRSSTHGWQVLRWLSHLIVLNIALTLGLVVARHQTRGWSVSDSWEQFLTWALLAPVLVFWTWWIRNRARDRRPQRSTADRRVRFVLPQVLFTASFLLVALVFLRVFFGPRGSGDWNEMLSLMGANWWAILWPLFAAAISWVLDRRYLLDMEPWVPRRLGAEGSLLILFLTGSYFFLRELFWEPGGHEAMQELLAAASGVAGSELGSALFVAGGVGFVASASAYFLAKALLSWEQFRTGTNVLWRACLLLLAVGILWSWLTSRNGLLADLNEWFEVTNVTVWIVALALYMGLAWKRVLRWAVLAGAGSYALLAVDQQGLYTLLRAGKGAFRWVFSPPKGGGAVDLLVRLLESTGKVLGSWQGLLCLMIVVLAYVASAWARRRIQDRAAAMWRGEPTISREG
ncbi:phospholipase effector Tle1 domain-containing protein [Candidatus Palauibacter sp.]|uniref:phospholipase effector Tle1 domain-containing protein n=1 Tax=Candidatus Palauibacter sp. TaxID=3101350 RepID=UPI003B016F96